MPCRACVRVVLDLVLLGSHKDVLDRLEKRYPRPQLEAAVDRPRTVQPPG